MGSSPCGTGACSIFSLAWREGHSGESRGIGLIRVQASARAQQTSLHRVIDVRFRIRIHGMQNTRRELFDLMRWMTRCCERAVLNPRAVDAIFLTRGKNGVRSWRCAAECALKAAPPSRRDVCTLRPPSCTETSCIVWVFTPSGEARFHQSSQRHAVCLVGLPRPLRVLV